MQALYFVDAWFFVAFLDRRDSQHRQARRIAASFDRNAWITSTAVLSEVLAFFSDDDENGRQAAARAVREALHDIEVITPDRSLFERALDLYEQRPDKEYSLVDCMSLVIMREREITHVLTNDHHFRQEGFTVLSDAP